MKKIRRVFGRREVELQGRKFRMELRRDVVWIKEKYKRQVFTVSHDRIVAALIGLLPMHHDHD